MNVPRLQSSQGNERVMEPVQQPAMPVLHGPLDPAHRQAEDADQRADNGAAAGGAIGGGRMGTRRSADSQDGEGASVSGAMRLRERDCKDFVQKEKHE